MQFIKSFKTKNSRKIEKLEGELKKQVKKVQELGDVLSFQDTEPSTYKGNEYLTYEAAVIEIDKKYRGVAEWGTVETGNIIDVRAAFIIAQGLNVVIEDKNSKKEQEFAEAFLKYNFLFQEMPMEYTKEAEIEGKFLAELSWNETDKNVKLRYIPFTGTSYQVKTDGSDYLIFKEVEFKGKAKKKKLLQPNFVYKRFGGRVFMPNHPAMKVWKCLTQIDGLDRALRDLREINNLFATPIPYMKCATALEAKQANEVIDKLNWKARKAFASTGDFKYISPQPGSTEMIIKEIETKSKIISGSTGVPVHFLGFPDLLSNRATADNLLELIWASTTKEREIWTGAYNEALNKAMVIQNEKKGRTKLEKGKVSIEIKGIPKDELAYLKEFYLPAFLSGKISLDLFLSKIPGINVEAEKKLIAEQEEINIEKMKLETLDNEQRNLDNIKKKEDENG